MKRWKLSGRRYFESAPLIDTLIFSDICFRTNQRTLYFLWMFVWEQEEVAQESESEDEEQAIYNPLKLPMGWDGKPIPYWLYKLHGLGQVKTCLLYQRILWLWILFYTFWLHFVYELPQLFGFSVTCTWSFIQWIACYHLESSGHWGLFVH